ncbi:MAG: nicotinamide-nucleotide adenylyltransferase [Thermoplasmatales archaeon]|nr:nicotinamide-nucleotide adenylyltransferase [Thermoplasmatales archaeon]
MRALIIGRFQPFHIGHAKISEKSKKYEIIFAIGSAYESFTFENPFTCSERYEMIILAMKEKKIKNYHIVPVPDINRYGLYAKHVKEIVPPFDLVISNNQLIKELFEREGYRVVEMPFFKRDVYQGRVIREKISKRERWENLVPKSVANFIKEINGEERIRKIAEMGCKNSNQFNPLF